jgi:glycosyltransferase involved in cell wall biosynthesis
MKAKKTQKLKSEMKKAVVIPCYRVGSTIRDIICTIPDIIDVIIVVDDCCPEQSGKLAQETGDSKVVVVTHNQNKGVGGAMISGYRKALELQSDIIIKMDGDGQMDPAYIEALISPILNGEADYTKGNRFYDFKALRAMPKVRLIGNNILSFLEKIFCGYWDIMDPTNGYTAIDRRVLEKLRLDKIAKCYFFESHMLLNLYLINAVVKDVTIPAKYENNNSSLKIRKTLLKFPPRLVYGFVKRILLKYFIYDFNMASIYILLGFPMFLWSAIFGIFRWIGSSVRGVPQTAGTIMLSALPLIISFEMLLQAINIDINSVPKRKK